EFKLIPSGDVWQRVEQRIREDKRKRRIIFFILFSFIGLTLVGYGLYHFSVHSEKPTASNERGTNDRLQRVASGTQDVNATDKKEQTWDDKTGTTEDISPNKNKVVPGSAGLPMAGRPIDKNILTIKSADTISGKMADKTQQQLKSIKARERQDRNFTGLHLG